MAWVASLHALSCHVVMSVSPVRLDGLHWPGWRAALGASGNGLREVAQVACGTVLNRVVDAISSAPCGAAAAHSIARGALPPLQLWRRRNLREVVERGRGRHGPLRVHPALLVVHVVVLNVPAVCQRLVGRQPQNQVPARTARAGTPSAERRSRCCTRRGTTGRHTNEARAGGRAGGTGQRRPPPPRTAQHRRSAWGSSGSCARPR